MFSGFSINSFVDEIAYLTVDKAKLFNKYLGKDLGWFIKLNCKIDADGLENLPKEGPFIIAANHLKVQTGFVRPVYDALVISLLAYKQSNVNIRWLARPTMAFDIPGTNRGIPLPLKSVYLRIFENKYGALMIDPNNPNAKYEVVDNAVDCLLNDEVVGIMPEGDIHEEMSKAKKGLYFIAANFQKRSGGERVPIIPIAAWGMEKAVWGKRRPVKVRVCEPIYIKDGDEPQKLVDNVMVEIAKKVPRGYRGYYSKYI